MDYLNLCFTLLKTHHLVESEKLSRRRKRKNITHLNKNAEYDSQFLLVIVSKKTENFGKPCFWINLVAEKMTWRAKIQKAHKSTKLVVSAQKIFCNNFLTSKNEFSYQFGQGQ